MVSLQIPISVVSFQIFVLDDCVVPSIPRLSVFAIGPILDPSSFYNKWFQRIGWVTKGTLEQAINDFRLKQKEPVIVTVDYAINALEKLGVCFELESQPGVYCIPAHINDNDRQNVWLQDSKLTKYVGRREECVRETDMFCPGLFPCFQCLAAVNIDHNACVWKGGIKLVDDHEDTAVTECLVELSKLGRAIDVVVRGAEGSGQQCVAFLTKLMTALNEMLKSKSPGTLTQRCYLSRGQIEARKIDPLGFTEEKVLEAKRTGKKFVRMSCNHDTMADNLADLMVADEEEAVFRQTQAAGSAPSSSVDLTSDHGPVAVEGM